MRLLQSRFVYEGAYSNSPPVARESSAHAALGQYARHLVRYVRVLAANVRHVHVLDARVRDRRPPDASTVVRWLRLRRSARASLALSASAEPDERLVEISTIAKAIKESPDLAAELDLATELDERKRAFGVGASSGATNCAKQRRGSSTSDTS